jgi:hypothetical protein
MRRLIFAGLLAGTALVFGGGSAAALLAGDCDAGEAQFQVELTAGPGANQVSFTFTNSGPDDSSITVVYFDDGTLLSLASIVDGTGVDLESGASPGNLPAANNASPPFEATAGLVAGSQPPVQPNGVNPGEELTLIFDLLGGKTLADTEAAIGDGSLRIGLHVQGFESGGSESFVSVPVPEPSVSLVLGAALLGLVRRSRR